MTMLDLNHIRVDVLCLRQILEAEVYISTLKGRQWKLC